MASWQVDSNSIQWAFKHVARFGTTDKLPRPFELDAISADPSSVQAHLASIDVSSYTPQTSLSIMAPKSYNGFRLAMEVDPLDTILLTAMVHQYATEIEDFRAARHGRTSCAYRLQPETDGRLFEAGNGWREFTERTEAACEALPDGWIVCTDITDFYGSIYTHRLQNALSEAGLPDERAKAIAGWMEKLNDRASQGIPVGPTASIVLAEVCLADVDKWLALRGQEHCRYVDDIRLFVRDEASAITALHDLAGYLYKVHRLSLSAAKTELLPRSAFLRRDLDDPDTAALRATRARIEDALGDVETWYGVPLEEPPELSEADVRKLELAGLQDLFGDAVQRRRPALPLLRFLLRRARSMESRVVFDLVCKNLPHLVPILPDACQYLLSVCRQRRGEVGSALVHLAEQSSWRHLPFVQLWVMDCVAQQPEMVTQDTAKTLLDNATEVVKKRYRPLLSRSYRWTSLVREYRQNLDACSTPERRAVLWSASILPADERRAWLDQARSGADFLTQLVAKRAARP